MRIPGTTRRMRTMHRIYGYFDPAYGLWAAEQIFGQAQDGRLDPASLATAAGMIRQAAAFSPFDEALLGLAEHAARLSPPPPAFPGWLEGVRKLTSGAQRCPQEQAVQRMETVRGDERAVQERLRGSLPLNERHLCLLELWRLGERDAFLEHLEPFAALPEAAPALPLLAFAAWRCEVRDLATALLERTEETFLSRNLRAQLALERGQADQARMHWRRSLELEPLQPALVYTLRAAAEPGPDPGLVDRARVHVAFYTYNKLDVTLDTLRSLLDSHIGPAAVTLLDNGSTAFDHRDLAAGVDRVRQGRPVDLIRLPVNVGAPAARNWLRSLPATAACDYLAYLDDDIFLPKDWLAHYLQDMREHPGTTCVGPMSHNPGALPTVQYVWRFFEKVGNHQIVFTNNCPLHMDMGQFRARRPCLSVMGCCHLFDMQEWQRLGLPDFDLRFSPSQVDDLEHDLQLWQAGGRVLYDGRVCVVHRQDGGRQAPLSHAAWAHVMGNHRKMEAKFDGRALHGLDRAVARADDAWWRQSLDMVGQWLPPAARELLQDYGCALGTGARERTAAAAGSAGA